MDYDRLAQELIRALRGSRSQVALSRRLGYSSNALYTWESGRRWPTAAVAMWTATRVGVDLDDAVTRFYRTPPPWLADASLHEPAGIAAFLEDLRGGMPIVDVAKRAERSRFAVSRWLKGEAEPRLPDFLRMIDATSFRALDFVAMLVDPNELPSIAEVWQRRLRASEVGLRAPWALALLLALELDDYLALATHQPGWLAARLGIGLVEEQTALALLAETDQIRWNGTHWTWGEVQAVDTRARPEAGRFLKRWWAERALDRMDEGADGVFSFNVFTVSSADYERLKEAQRSYYRELRSIVANSEPADRVVTTSLLITALDDEEPS